MKRRKPIGLARLLTLSLILGFIALVALTACAGAPERGREMAASGAGESDEGAVIRPAAEPAPKPAMAAAPPPRSEKDKAEAAPGDGSESKSLWDAEGDMALGYAPEGLAEERSYGFGGGSSAGGSPSASGLKAGYSDDNEQYNLFLTFLEKYASVPHRPVDVGERITLEIRDAEGKAVANAKVSVRSGTKLLDQGVSLPDGRFRLYPAAYGALTEWDVRVESSAGGASIKVARAGARTLPISLAERRKTPTPLPLDVLFVMDTTGSMGEEIERLRATIEIIHDNLLALSPKPQVRFGLVLYKDQGDDYVTRVVPFTADLESFRKSLSLVYASGGGDTPEDLEAALDDAVTRMRWNSDGVRLAFVVTDATAQLGYERDFDYASSMAQAREKGIKFHTIGTGGLDLDGEYILRQIAQYSGGRYIFLTYGERDESAGGTEGSVSHHTGSNFTSDKLETIVIRFVKEDLSALSDKPLVDMDEDYYEARRIEAESKDATLGKLFAEALGNLVDYSSIKIEAKTPVAIMPMAVADPALAATAEYFAERLLLAASEKRPFTIVERANLQKILEELELQLSGLADEATVAKVGGLLGAEAMLTGSLVERDGRYEVFFKLVRVSTAEVLAVVRAKVEKNLGL